YILFADLNGFLVCLEIVVAVGQAEAALIETRDHLGRILGVLLRGKSEKSARAFAIKADGDVSHRGFVVHGRDRGKIGFKNGDAARFDAFFVHAGGVIITDLLVDGRASRAVHGGGFKYVLEDGPVTLLKDVEAAPARLIRWDRVIFHPGAAGVLIKI